MMREFAISLEKDIQEESKKLLSVLIKKPSFLSDLKELFSCGRCLLKLLTPKPKTNCQPSLKRKFKSQKSNKILLVFKNLKKLDQKALFQMHLHKNRQIRNDIIFKY
jgi:hypothetical protein